MSSKNIIAIVLVVVGLLAVVAGAILLLKKDTKDDGANQSNQSTKTEGETPMNKDGKSIVVYFSAQNHTRNVATKIAANVGADVFEIEPVQAYTEDDLSWTNSGSRVSREHNDESLQTIELKNTDVPNWKEYDTVTTKPLFHSAPLILLVSALVIRILKPKLLAVIGNRAIVSRKMLPMWILRLGPIVCYNIHIGQLSRIMPVSGFESPP